MKKLLMTFSVFALSFAAEQSASMYTAKVESANTNEMQLTFNADADIYGLQFDLYYDDTQININEENCQDVIKHSFAGTDVRANANVHCAIKDGFARVIMFDLAGNPILYAGNEESIVTINYDVVDGFVGNTVVETKNTILAKSKGEGEYPQDTKNNILVEGAEPYETSIKGNYPNPFNPTTTIEFDLAKAGYVDVTIYDLQGRKVVNLFSGNLTQSEGYTFNWDASSVASGQYFARITAPGFSDVINMTLLK